MVEVFFWKVLLEKVIFIEYVNDILGFVFVELREGVVLYLR